MHRLVLLAALLACLTLPAAAQDVPPEAQLSPQSAPVGTLKLVEQSPMMPLGQCRDLLLQRLKSQRLAFDADNFNENPAARDAPFSATVIQGERVLRLACEWAQQPCLPISPRGGGPFPQCDPDKIILKTYQEG